jgi:hypothetical protein
MFEFLKLGFKDLAKKLWIPSLYYFIISILPLILGIQMFEKLLEVSDNSLILNKLVENFDFAIFTDFWRLNSDKLQPVFLKAAWAIPIIYFLKLFITGGNIDAMNEGIFNLKRYLRQCNKYFWRMFRLDILHFFALIMILVIAILVIFILVPYLTDVNELQLFARLGSVIGFSVILICLFDLFKDYCIQRIFFTGSHSVRKTFLDSVKYVLQSPKTYFFRITFYGFGLTWLLVYLETEKIISGTGISVWITIICQQFYVIGKHFLRFWHLITVQKIQDKRPVSSLHNGSFQQ